jgi:hypothetical protein
VKVMLVGVAESTPPLVGVQLEPPTVTVTFAVVVTPFALTCTDPVELPEPDGRPEGLTETVSVGLLDVVPEVGVTER